MDFEVDLQLSCAADDLLERLNARFGSGKSSELSNTWLEFLNYELLASSHSLERGVKRSAIDVIKDIINSVKESLERNVPLSETVFMGLSVNQVNTILFAVKDFIDEMKFSAFCNLISSWNNSTLVEYSLRLIVLPKLQESNESSTCIIHSVKELALSKPDHISRNVIIPLLKDDSFQFPDFELLTKVLSVLPHKQKDFIILTLSKKPEFCENDWQLLNLVFKYLSKNSLLVLMECIWKFSHNFTKSRIFGQFLVSLCKQLKFTRKRKILRKVVNKHETLQKNQALQHLDSIRKKRL